MATIEDAYREAVAAFGSVRQVTGIDIGPKFKKSKKTDITSVRFHVTTKRPPETLVRREKFPEKIGGYPIDVVQRRYVLAIEGLPQGSLNGTAPGAQRFAPLRPGISVSHRLCPSGTLGVFVQDDEDNGSLALLTNWHILADSSFIREGDGIFQPGATDGGLAADTVATYTRSILGADGDAAIATINGRRATDSDIRLLNRVPDAIADPQPGDVVVKCGRSTNVTEGKVEGHGTYYPIYRTRDRVGIEGFEIVPLEPGNPHNIELSTNGDSGSAWLIRDTNTLVGLHFAGERDGAPSKEVALACYATRVFNKLSISLP
jgi:endonuclease G